jgi:Protein of unknown function (DUF3887)
MGAEDRARPVAGVRGSPQASLAMAQTEPDVKTTLTEQSPGETDREHMALLLERNVEVVLAALRATADGDGGSPLTVLAAACGLADTADDAIQALVRDARAAGHTWHEIGELLAISRQAAQQRFGRPAGEKDPDEARMGARAVEIVEQLARHDWEAAGADWDETMRAKLPIGELVTTWQQIITNAGALTAVGRPSTVRRGPYRVCDVPLVFEHGPMRARVSFNRTGSVSGLFITLPE